MLQVCGHSKHVVVLVVLLCVINSLVISVPTYSHLSPVCEFLAIALTAKTGPFEVLPLQTMHLVPTSTH